MIRAQRVYCNQQEISLRRLDTSSLILRVGLGSAGKKASYEKDS
jgi:hypothetical protein